MKFRSATMLPTLGLLASWVFLTAAITPAPSLNLNDCMDSHYGAGNWTQRTAPGVGTDIGPALNDCLASIRTNYHRGTVVIPPGSWLMNTAPLTSNLSGNYIQGYGSQASVIFFNNGNGVAFDYSGYNGYTGGGIRGIGLLLESGLSPSQTNSYGIYLVGNSTYQPDQMEFDDIYLSAAGGSSYWYDGFHADGTARTSPQGIRVVSINNMQVFNCHNVGVYIANAVQWSITNLGTYTGSGNGNDWYITGGSSSSTYSTQLTSHRIYVGGSLHLDHASDISLEGKIELYLDAQTTASYVSGWVHAINGLSGSFGSVDDLTVRQ